MSIMIKVNSYDVLIGTYAALIYMPRRPQSQRVLFAAPKGPAGKAKGYPEPEAGVYPNFMRDSAKETWDSLFGTYDDVLDKAKAKHGVEGMWAAAILIVQNLHKLKNLGEVFDETLIREKTSVIYRRAAASLYKSYHALIAFMDKIRETLAKQKLISDESLKEAGPEYLSVDAKLDTSKHFEFFMYLGFEFSTLEGAGMAVGELDTEAIGKVLLETFNFKKQGALYTRGAPAGPQMIPGSNGKVTIRYYPKEGTFTAVWRWENGEATGMFGTFQSSSSKKDADDSSGKDKMMHNIENFGSKLTTNVERYLKPHGSYK